MSQDISQILQDWPHDEATNIRKIVGDDGREKVQIRVVIQTYQGILQFDCDGRPDGQRPHDCDFALDHWQGQARRKPEFQLSAQQAKELFDESAMIYQRYAVLLQLADYQRVIRDTERNMHLFRFVHRHAPNHEDRTRLEKWWPYVIRIHHTAWAMLHLQSQNFDAALQAVRTARRQIHQLDELDDDTFRNERERSFTALEELEKTIEKQRPLDETEELERQKRQAIQREDFELAAKLRDQIAARKKAREQQDGPNP